MLLPKVQALLQLEGVGQLPSEPLPMLYQDTGIRVGKSIFDGMLAGVALQSEWTDLVDCYFGKLHDDGITKRPD